MPIDPFKKGILSGLVPNKCDLEFYIIHQNRGLEILELLSIPDKSRSGAPQDKINVWTPEDFQFVLKSAFVHSLKYWALWIIL